MTQSLSNTPDQSAIDAVNLSRIKFAQDEFNSQNGTLRSVFAKAEQQGLHLPAAKRAIKVIRSGKKDEMIEEFSKTVYYLRLLGKPVEKSQIDMFDVLMGPAPEDEKAREEGLAAGRGGEAETSSPYEAGSTKGQSWLSAYREGLEERNLVLSMKIDDEDDDSDADED